MAYLAQTFTAAQVLTAGQMNQVESNITAARTHDKGATAPPTLSAGLTWLEDDNPSATVWRWQMYDGTDWIALLDLDTTNNQIELPNVASINGHGMWGNRNLLINADHKVDQRAGDTRTGLGAATAYLTDRWFLDVESSASARWTASQESSGGLSGAAKWLKMLCTTADASPGANEAMGIRQSIEAQNGIAVLDDSGDVVATTYALDVICHKNTDTAPYELGLAVECPDGSRMWVGNVTVAADATWERVNITVPADTTATVANDTGVGIKVTVCLYGGSSRLATEGWQSNATTLYGETGADNFATEANDYVGFTEAQLEVGSTATAFEHRPIADELLRCQRYFEQRDYDSVSSEQIGSGGATTASAATIALHYSKKRAIPTIGFTAGNTFMFVDIGNNGNTCTSIAAGAVGVQSCTINPIDSGNFTGGTGTGYLSRAGTTTCSITIDAEL